MSDPFNGAEPVKIKTSTGVTEDRYENETQAEWIYRIFLQRIRAGRPENFSFEHNRLQVSPAYFFNCTLCTLYNTFIDHGIFKTNAINPNGLMNFYGSMKGQALNLSSIRERRLTFCATPIEAYTLIEPASIFDELEKLLCSGTDE